MFSLLCPPPVSVNTLVSNTQIFKYKYMCYFKDGVKLVNEIFLKILIKVYRKIKLALSYSLSDSNTVTFLYIIQR